MSCTHWESRIDDWIAGRGDDDERAAVEGHLAVCASCRHHEEASRRLRRAVEALPRARQPERDLWPGIAERLQARPKKDETGVLPTPFADRRPVVRRPLDVRRWHGAWQLLAALLLIAVGALASRWLMPAPSAGDASSQLAQGGATGFVVPARVAPEDLNLDGDVLAAYAAARTALVATIDGRRDALRPETVAAVERNLAVIDQAIGEIESALREDVGNPRLERMLLASYRREIDLLQRLAATET